MPGYVNVLQGKIARYDENTTPQNIIGFFTDGVSTCCFVVFSGKKDGKRRISAFHSDGYLFNVEPQRLLDERDWVGELEACYLYRDPTFDTDTPHPIVAFAASNNIPLIQKTFDSRNSDVDEMAITFDESKKGGHTFRAFKHNTFRGEIINHPQAAQIYTLYKLNTNIQEIDSNRSFAKLCKTDMMLLFRWNSNMLTFTQRRRMTLNQSSTLTQNPIIFDSQVFTTPGTHDLNFTPFSTEFLQDYDQTLANTEVLSRLQQRISRTGIPLATPLSMEQLAIIKLMQAYDPSISISEPNDALAGVINHSGSISDLFNYVRSDFNIAVVNFPQIKNLLVRYTAITAQSPAQTNAPDVEKRAGSTKTI